MFMYTTPTFILEELCLVTQVQLLLMTYIELIPYAELVNSYWISFTMRINAKATPINTIKYICYITAVELA